MRETPLVSIITPTYNHQTYIKECIDSVKKQSFTKWEQIIIDDGSTDETLEVAKAAIGDDARFTLIKQENKGVFKLDETYNKALELCKGEYVAILEGDDYWEPEKLTLQVEEFEKNENVVLVWSKAYALQNTTNRIIGSIPNLKRYGEIELRNKPISSILNILLIENIIPALTIVIKKTTLLSIGGFQTGYSLPLVDLPTTLKIALRGEFVFINKELGVWRQSNDQITKTFSLEIKKGIYELKKDFIKSNIKNDSFFIKIKLDDIRTKHNSDLIITYSRLGRFALIKKEFKKARFFYKKSILKFGFSAPLWKLRSIVGYFLSFFKQDVELIAGILGSGRLDK